MKTRKQNSVKAGSSKRKAPSDVAPSTSLPPLVEGELRCFLCVAISRVIWTVHKPPTNTFVRLRWWGESSNGTHFFPRDGSQLAQKNIKTTARFAIRCGPKQFTSYLTDMGSLMVEVLTKPDHLPIARAQVAGISRLSLSQPISGFYTLVSPTSDKLGEVQVSLKLEPLTEAYDGVSSGPGTDVNAEGLHVPRLSTATQHKPYLAGSGNESAGSSDGNTPRGKDHLYFRNLQKEEQGTLETQKIIKSHYSQTNANPSPRKCLQEKSASDIISVILERGNKLRNAMVVSALNCDGDSASALRDAPLPLPKDNIQAPGRSTFLQNILLADSALRDSDDVALGSNQDFDCPVDMDRRAVDLLLGRTVVPSLPLIDIQDVSFESLSGHSSVGADSELNDPIYDQSLLENLFYKTPGIDSKPHDKTEERQEAKSSIEDQTNHNSLRQSGHKISLSPIPDNRVSAGCVYASIGEDQQAHLSSVRQVRVTICSLTVPQSCATPRKILQKGKPPRPLVNKKCTYFVEYMFPRSSFSSQHERSKTGEVTRAVSRKASGGVVKFQHVSIFPVHIRRAVIEKWWNTDLIFKIYIRRSDMKKPIAIGNAIYPLRSLLQKKQLNESIILPVHKLEGSSERQNYGPLKVLVELGSHSKTFSRNSENISRRNTSPSRFSSNADSETLTAAQDVELDCTDLSAHSVDNSPVRVWSPKKPARELFPPHVRTSSKSQRKLDEEEPEILLHALLMVPDGKNFSCGPLQVPNVYLNCKLFWCEETARSTVSWGQANPTFNFVQVTPVPLTSKLLERMKNNVMVIEVWQKAGSSGQDQLLGLVKLPLHQFYMSYKDPKIAQLLLQAQYPVLGVDCYMPVIDVFSGNCKGNLRTVLAMGLSEQIVSLQRNKDEEYGSMSHFVRPVHLLDHLPHSQTKVKTRQVEMMREHVFTVRVEKVTGLTPLQSTVWGEADCYVQYSFPCQEGDITGQLEENLIESTVNLKSFRSTTTLCIPDPVFNHTENHVLLAPLAVPVQRLLLNSLSSQGLSCGGGVQFEVWCRYYYPNVRDQLVARGMLPLSKLCAMVTMQRQHPNEVQMFSLPLIPRTDDSTEHPPPSGLLDVCIQYKHRPVRSEAQSGRGAASRIVTLVVQVHRASGLQAAAKVVSEGDGALSHLLSVGVKPFVTVQLSFLPENERRCTRTAARTFCPEFDHHMEVSCDLLLHMSSGETCSLAEQLEQGSAVFTVFNKNDHEANVSRSRDVMLGTVKIPLADLIHKRTGISGWFGLYLTRERSSSQYQHILVGGLEISINFAHHSDRERVLKAAQGLGWETSYKNMKLHVGEESWEESSKKLSLTLSMPKAWIPVHSLLLPGLTELQRSTYCYFRYKFYDQEAFCSQLKHPCVEENGPTGQATVTFEGSRTVDLRSTQPLMWYLREEKLEVQIWVTFTKNKTKRPSDSDRLVGSAFIDLSPFINTSKQKFTLSGVYPLFMRSAADLQGAALRVHITLMERYAVTESPEEHDSDSQEESFLEQAEATDQVPSPSQKSFKQKSKASRTTPDITSVQNVKLSLEETFPVTVVVERAMHLNLKGCPLAERSEGIPCCCVSYVTADSAEPVSTEIVTNTDCPVWEHQHECRLSKELLVDSQQSLVFKVWHKGEVDRVIGFASVDLSPLLCGLPSVCGWYNITDFSGQCRGQIKVSITPLKGVRDLREQRKTAANEPAKNSPVLLQSGPIHYQTTAIYSSFPSHISRYPEQQISSPVQTDKLFSESPKQSDRHDEHMDNVRLYHQNLQEQTSHLENDIIPSSSHLLSALRKNLGELDNIQTYFSQKVSTPVFPSLAVQDKQRNAETDSNQLLLRSKQLVGEVNKIMSGLQQTQPETIPSNTQNSTEPPPVEEESPQMIPETLSSPHIVADDYLDANSSLPSLSTERSVVHSDSEAEGENLCQCSKVSSNEDEEEMSEGEDREASDHEEDKEASGQEEEDYEEVVVKPRHLNEVTSLTDRTSPWTSILSDPDLLSLESMEALKEPELSEAGDENNEVMNVETQIPSDKHQDGLHSCSGSEGDTSDSETDVGRTPAAAMRTKKSDNSSGDTNSLPPRPLTAETHKAQSILFNKDAQLHPSTHVGIPNFFLSAQQLEASLRAIRLAPTFSHAPRNTSRSSSDQNPAPPRRIPLQRPNMSPSSMKKETERIAKIFAAKFDD